MIGLCLSAGTVATFLAIQQFTLSWIHSVERIEWQEDWRIANDRLVLTESRVKGNGAGMEPSPGAVFDGEWWHSHPPLEPRPNLILARSSLLPDWRLCTESGCRALGDYFPRPVPRVPLTLIPCAGIDANGNPL